MRGLVIKVAGILVVVAIIGVLVFRDRLPFGKANSSFAIMPGTAVTRIEFSSAGKKLVLGKEGENWIINGTASARKSGILFLTRVLSEIKIKSPVSDDLFRTEITEKGIEPERVRVFSGRKLVSSFLVYKTTSNAYGNIMKKRAGSRPFIVYVPGYEGEIASAFTMNGLFWQPYTVFSSLPSEIRSVQVENFADTASSFSVEARGHQFSLKASGKELSGWDPVLVNRYLSYFAFIPFEKWALDLDEAERKRLEGQAPAFRIVLKGTSGSSTELTLWNIKTGEGREAVTDSDRLFGKLQDGKEYFIMRYFDVDPILKKRSYFFTQ